MIDQTPMAGAVSCEVIRLVALIGLACTVVAAVVIGLLVAIGSALAAHPWLGVPVVVIGIVGAIFAYLGATT